MSTPRKSGTPRQPSGSTQAIQKVEKLTQVAFALPVAVLVGWLAGAGLDKLFHQHWIYIAGLVLGVIAGFIQLFRMIGDKGLLAASAPDPAAPKGPGFSKDDSSEGGDA